MFSIVKGCGLNGLDGDVVNVEINITNGIPCIEVIGKVDIAVKESRERVKAAIKNQGMDFPMQKIIINLSPADKHKHGTGFDLAIAVGILAAAGQIKPDHLNEYLIIGELSLNGQLRKVTGVLSMVLAACKKGISKVIVPPANVNEANVLDGVDCYAFDSLKEVVEFLNGKPAEVMKPLMISNTEHGMVDLKNIKGHHEAKRALEIAAAGGHSLLFIGSPGAGKTVLAKCITGIMPGLSETESLEVTRIHSICGLEVKGLFTERPFRNPHHTVTMQSFIGGGSNPKPGEITLAHHGVLFLDELAEFKAEVLDTVRQPMEDKHVVISRLKTTVVFPSNFLLIAAANPCRCGMLYEDRCTCSQTQIQKYRYRLSGPIIDRIEMVVHMSSVPFDDIHDEKQPEESSVVKARVVAARKKQEKRYSEAGFAVNGSLAGENIYRFCHITNEGRDFLKQYYTNKGLSVRRYQNIVKVSKTIADLAGEDEINIFHISEAVRYTQWMLEL